MAVRYCNDKKAFRIEINRVIGGHRHRMTKLLPKSVTESEARMINDKIEADLIVRSNLVAQSEDWAIYVESLMEKSTSWINLTLNGIKSRAKASGRACTLNAESIKQLMLRSRGRCELTGVQFDKTENEGRIKRPFFHSIDRIDSTKGYTSGNCRVICIAANVAMMDWGEEVFEKIAVGFVMNKYVASGLTSHSLALESKSYKPKRSTLKNKTA